MSIQKIVVTGGPCAGKSTAMSRIQSEFTKMGYTVLFIEETATELIMGGVDPVSCASPEVFQGVLMRLQLEKEKVFERAAQDMRNDNVLIVCDRGALDNKAYMTPEVFEAVLREVGSTEVELRDSYDAVFHLTTAAKGAERFYTLENNAARRETPEEAAAIDDRIIAAWTGHPHLRVIDNSSDFEGKLHRLMTEIAAFLGEPEPYEIERKYLISYPDLEWLSAQPNCQRVEIIQTYLRSGPDEEVRVRQRGLEGSYIYFKTVKRTVDSLKRIEIERKITQEEYLRLLMDADTTRRQIRKTRYCLAYQNSYLEIDVYPFWNTQAILEIELSDETAQVSIPPQLRVIREVTGDEHYRNAYLALGKPGEE